MRGISDADALSKSATARFGKYDVLRLLACGGQATVLLAFDPDLQREVVIKLYQQAEELGYHDRMIAEGRALARVRNPNVATCFSVETSNGVPFLVLEFVAGRTLSEIIEARRLSRSECREYVRQIASGLAEAHRMGLIHRDLKPSNVIITPDGTAKLIDFGLVHSLSKEALADHSGTTAYMPPEVARRELDRVDQRSDIFGIGAILYHMLSGEPPFSAESKSEATQRARECNVKPLMGGLGSIQAICMRCLERDMGQRYQSVTELIDDIDDIAERRRKSSIGWVSAALGVVFLTVAMLWQHANPSTATESISSSHLAMAMLNAKPDGRVQWQFKDDREEPITPDRTGTYRLDRAKNYKFYVKVAEPSFITAYGLPRRSFGDMKSEDPKSPKPLPEQPPLEVCLHHPLKEGVWTELSVPKGLQSLYVFASDHKTPPFKLIAAVRSGSDGANAYRVRFSYFAEVGPNGFESKEEDDQRSSPKALLADAYRDMRNRRFDSAYRHVEEYLQTGHEDPDSWKVDRRFILRLLGRLALSQNDTELARDWFSENLKRARNTGGRTRRPKSDLAAVEYIENLDSESQKMVIQLVQELLAGVGLVEVQFRRDFTYDESEWQKCYSEATIAKESFESPACASFELDSLYNLYAIGFDLNQGSVSYDAEYLDSCRRLLGPHDVITIDALQGIACTASDDESAVLLSKALDTAKEHLGGDHPLTVKILCSLGFTYTQLDMLEQARASYQEALSHIEKNKNPRAALLLARLSDVERKDSRFKEALDAAEEAASIMEACGPDTYAFDDYLRVRVYLATAKIYARQYEDGLSDYQELEEMGWQYYERKPSMAGLLGDYALSLAIAKQYQNAIDKIDEALAIYREFLETCPYVESHMDSLLIKREELVQLLSDS